MIMIKHMRFMAVILVILSSGVALAQSDYVLKGGTLITVTGDTIPEGTLIISGRTIADLGSDVPIPTGAEIIDCSGMYIYPGMTDAVTTLGLSEVSAVAATVDSREVGDYNPQMKAIVALNVHSVHIAVSRVNGITSALVVPGGGVISGQAVLVNLNGWTPDQMALKEPAAMILNFPRQPVSRSNRGRELSEEESARARDRVDKQLQGLKDLLAEARRYGERWSAYKKNSKGLPPDRDYQLEALLPVVRKELLVLVRVDNEKDILNAIEFIEKEDLKAALVGCGEGWKVADKIKESGLPVLVGPVLRSVGLKDPYDAAYADAGALQRAGVKIAFFTGGAADVRSLPYHAGTAAAYGLDKGEALRAVTINPAEIFGVADRIGSLEKGKLANIVVADGDILEMATKIKHLFITGDHIALTSKHTELYEQFRNRPPDSN